MEPWQSKLAEGNPQAAWDLFASRYRKLILATIRRLIHDHDHVMDVFSEVCAALAANDLARLQRFTERHPRGASAATWLVVVVRNLTIDWVRKQEGRDRHQLPAGLSPLQQQIYTAVFLEGASHVEAYETIRAQGGTQESFPAFLRAVRETYRLAPRRSGAMLRPPGPPRPALELETTVPLSDPAETAEASRRVANALAGLAPDVALAVQLFVVDRLSAAEIARAVGWPNPKMVYNKVYRALTALR